MKKKTIFILIGLYILLVVIVALIVYYQQKANKANFEKVVKESMTSFTTSNFQNFYYLDKDGFTFYKVDKNNEKKEKVIQKTGDTIASIKWDTQNSIKAIAQSQTPAGDVESWLVNLSTQKIYSLGSNLRDTAFSKDDTIATIKATDNNYHLILAKTNSPDVLTKDYDLKNKKCDTIINFDQKNNLLTCLADLSDVSASIQTINLNSNSVTVFEGDFSVAKISPDATKILALKNINETESKWVVLDIKGKLLSEISLPTNFYDINKTVWSPDSSKIISAVQQNNDTSDTLYLINPTNGSSPIININSKTLPTVDAQYLLISNDNKSLYFISGGYLYRKSL